MKAKFFPNYVNLYTKINETVIRLDRKCQDGVKRFITYLNFDSEQECLSYWETECGA